MPVSGESEMKSLSRVTLSDPMDCSLPGSSVHGIFQARILEWVAIAFSEISGHSPLIKEIYYANRIGMLIGWTESLQNKT